MKNRNIPIKLEVREAIDGSPIYYVTLGKGFTVYRENVLRFDPASGKLEIVYDH